MSPLRRSFSLPFWSCAFLALSSCSGSDESQDVEVTTQSEVEPSPQPTPAKSNTAQKLANRLSRSSEGLKVEQRADGTLALDLQGRFQHVMVLSPEKTQEHPSHSSGESGFACVDTVPALERQLAPPKGP